MPTNYRLLLGLVSVRATRIACELVARTGSLRALSNRQVSSKVCVCACDMLLTLRAQNLLIIGSLLQVVDDGAQSAAGSSKMSNSVKMGSSSKTAAAKPTDALITESPLFVVPEPPLAPAERYARAPPLPVIATTADIEKFAWAAYCETNYLETTAKVRARQ
jgi:hypothetical protein